MRVQIDYKNDKTYGMDKSEELYMARVTEENKNSIALVFDFPKFTKGMDEKSEIQRVKINLEKDEVEEIITALQSFLHHPSDKGKSKNWVNFRKMPPIRSNYEVLEQIECSWTDGLMPSLTFTNNSNYHFSRVLCKIQGDETIETEFTINLAPGESKKETLKNIGKISEVNIKGAHGCKMGMH